MALVFCFNTRLAFFTGTIYLLFVNLAVFHYKLYVLKHGDIGQWITFNSNNISQFTGFQCPEGVFNV